MSFGSAGRRRLQVPPGRAIAATWRAPGTTHTERAPQGSFALSEAIRSLASTSQQIPQNLGVDVADQSQPAHFRKRSLHSVQAPSVKLPCRLTVGSILQRSGIALTMQFRNYPWWARGGNGEAVIKLRLRGDCD